MLTDLVIKRRNVLRNLTVEFASIVDKGANPGAAILIAKRDDATKGVTMQPQYATEREAAWAGIEQLGAEIRKAAPGLTREQANAKAMDTTAGRALVQAYNDPLSALTIADAAKQRKYLDAIGTPGDAVDWAAREIQKREGCDYATACHRATERVPNLLAAYHRGAW